MVYSIVYSLHMPNFLAWIYLVKCYLRYSGKLFEVGSYGLKVKGLCHSLYVCTGILQVLATAFHGNSVNWRFIKLHDPSVNFVYNVLNVVKRSSSAYGFNGNNKKLLAVETSNPLGIFAC